MRNFKRYISFVAVFAMLFTSCSKEEVGVNPDSKATLSFGAVVSDLITRSQTKDHLSDFPECSDDTPTYVEIILMEGETEIVGTSGNPFRIDLVAGKLFTSEVPELELEEGIFTLDHFAVYNDDGELIWVAPRAGSSLEEYVNSTLPMDIDLRSGVKKYVEVSVLCFDNRDVNEYGYLFFELDTNIAIEYCFFANFCNTDGRHYPASYRVSIWAGTSSSGTPLYTNVVNNTGQYENGDYFATPLCFALPDNDNMNEDYLYYEVTLLDWEGVYGDVDQMMVNGTLSKQDIMNNFDGDDNTEYQHIRFGCGEDDPSGPEDSDNDGVIDSEDQCPNQAGPTNNNGCPVAPPADTDGDGVIDTEDQCPNQAGPATNNGCPVTEPVDSDGDGIIDSEDQCPNQAGPANNNGCPVTPPADTDGDGVIDSEDQCPNQVGPATNNGCPVTAPVDTDSDGVIDSEDQCPNQAGTVANNGCPVFTCEVNEFNFGNLDGCQFAYINGSTGFVEITGDIPWYLAFAGQSAPGVGALTVRIDSNGNINVSGDLSGISNVITGYEIVVTDNSSFCEILSVDLRTTPSEIEDTFDTTIDLEGAVSYPIFVKVKVLVCSAT